MSLFDFICTIKSAVFAHIEYVSNVKLPKYLGFAEKVSKVVSLTCQLNYGYADAVKRRIESNGNDPQKWVEESLPWGEWEVYNKVITHKGERYLRYFCLKNQPCEVTYYVGERLATADEIEVIKNYQKSLKKAPTKQIISGVAEDNVLLPKAIKFSGIRSLKTNGFEWTPNQTATEIA